MTAMSDTTYRRLVTCFGGERGTIVTASEIAATGLDPALLLGRYLVQLPATPGAIQGVQVLTVEVPAPVVELPPVDDADPVEPTSSTVEPTGSDLAPIVTIDDAHAAYTAQTAEQADVTAVVEASEPVAPVVAPAPLTPPPAPLTPPVKAAGNKSKKR
jgi:hypothetical protein